MVLLAIRHLLILALACAAWACKYDGQEKKNGDEWKTGGFVFRCLINEDKSWKVTVVGCVWSRTGDEMTIGEEKQHKEFSARCYKDDDYTRFEEKAIPSDKKPDVAKPDDKKPTEEAKSASGEKDGGDVKPSEDLKCLYNGKSHSNGATWREGSFKFLCETGDFGWKADIVACFWKEQNDLEVPIGETKEANGDSAKCYKEDEITRFEVTSKAKKTASKKDAGDAGADKPAVDFSVDIVNEAKTETSGKCEDGPPKTEKKDEKDEKVVKKPEPKEPEMKPEEKKPEPKSEEKKPEPKAEERKPEPKSEEKKPEPKPEEKKPEPKSEEKKPEPKSEEKKPEPKSEEKKPEPKPDVKKPDVKPEEKKDITCKHEDKDRKKDETWTNENFKYKCTTTDASWKVEIVACIWQTNGKVLELTLGDTKTEGKYTASCTQEDAGTVSFAEKFTGK